MLEFRYVLLLVNKHSIRVLQGEFLLLLGFHLYDHKGGIALDVPLFAQIDKGGIQHLVAIGVQTVVCHIIHSGKNRSLVTHTFPILGVTRKEQAQTVHALQTLATDDNACNVTGIALIVICFVKLSYLRMQR